MTLLSVEHVTTYRYARPVTFQEHRLMCRPRDSHDLRLIGTTLDITPAAGVRWLHDVFGNSIAIASFGDASAAELVFRWGFRVEHYPVQPDEVRIEDYARALPFSYAAEDVSDLGRTRERHYADPAHRVDLWAKGLAERCGADTLAVLRAMTQGIHDELRYEAREEHGTRPPVETLERGSGSCRDFALLMMEGARSLGLAARFVSGYLYDDQRLGLAGSGATHAWAQVFLPGAGWVEFDPTNAISGGRNLIRVAVARDASQAAPLTGSFTGAAADYLGMSVEVSVTADAPQSASE